eukprot:6173045-Pleurochrysis_carterae.AAC.2
MTVMPLFGAQDEDGDSEMGGGGGGARAPPVVDDDGFQMPRAANPEPSGLFRVTVTGGSGAGGSGGGGSGTSGLFRNLLHEAVKRRPFWRVVYQTRMHC